MKSIYLSLLFKRAEQALAGAHQIAPIADGL
jgi:hypothetical protein